MCATSPGIEYHGQRLNYYDESGFERAIRQERRVVLQDFAFDTRYDQSSRLSSLLDKERLKLDRRTNAHGILIAAGRSRKRIHRVRNRVGGSFDRLPAKLFSGGSRERYKRFAWSESFKGKQVETRSTLFPFESNLSRT